MKLMMVARRYPPDVWSGTETVFQALYERAHRAYPVREDNAFFTVSMPFAVLRYACLEIGRRLVARGLLDEVEHVFFLLDEELEPALIGGTRIDTTERRGQARWAKQVEAPGYFGPAPTPPPSVDWAPARTRDALRATFWYLDAVRAAGREAPSGDAVAGIGASAGSYEGRVCVVHDESEFHKIRPGDVLVCPNTTPVWSMVFATVGAVVCDAGGALAHPAIIAREHRIPAVLATGRGTKLLRDGDRVRVDGDAGTVTRL